MNANVASLQTTFSAGDPKPPPTPSCRHTGRTNSRADDKRSRAIRGQPTDTRTDHLHAAGGGGVQYMTIFHEGRRKGGEGGEGAALERLALPASRGTASFTRVYILYFEPYVYILFNKLN